MAVVLEATQQLTAAVDAVCDADPSQLGDAETVRVRRRIFSGATRRAVGVRDRECFKEFCDVGAEDCQIDHVWPW